MPKYIVTLPFTGYATIEVEAESNKDALETAFENVRNEHIEELEYHEHVCQGNVFNGLLNDYEIETEEEEE